MNEEFEVVIMIAAQTEEMHGSDRVPILTLIASEPGLEKANQQRERNGALLRVLAEVCTKNA